MLNMERAAAWKQDGFLKTKLAIGCSPFIRYTRLMDASITTTPDCLPEAIDLITREFDPLRIILFGSWARGDARPDSDLDLLVVLSALEDKRQATVSLMRALNPLPISKDVVVTTPQEIAERGDVIGHVLRPALREGVVVYERE